MIKAPRAGFILLAMALHLAVAAFIVYAMTFDAFHYVPDNWVIALMIIVIWSIAALLISSFFMGDKPLFVDALYIVIIFALVTATVKFVTPCLSPIGIYFTVHNMGDVEANEIGVPRSIAGIVIFVLTILLVLISAFFLRTKKEIVNIAEKTEQPLVNESEEQTVNDDTVTEFDSEHTTEKVSKVYEQVMDEAAKEADNV